MSKRNGNEESIWRGSVIAVIFVSFLGGCIITNSILGGLISIVGMAAVVAVMESME